MRLGQPITNMRHFSNAHAIAASLPSIGAYLCSASMQILLLVNIRCQPSGQQTLRVEVFLYKYQLQFIIVAGTVLSYSFLYFSLPAGTLTVVSVIVIILQLQYPWCILWPLWERFRNLHLDIPLQPLVEYAHTILALSTIREPVFKIEYLPNAWRSKSHQYIYTDILVFINLIYLLFLLL